MSSQPVTRARASSQVRTHLAKLAQALERYGWAVALSPGRSEPVLIVTGPEGDPSETIVCRPADGTWHYLWGPNLIRTCPTSRAGFAAVRIDNQLRGSSR